MRNVFGLGKKYRRSRSASNSTSNSDFSEKSVVVVEEEPVVHMPSLTNSSGRHTIVRAKKKRRPSLQNLEEVTVHCGELSETERVYILDRASTGVKRIGHDRYGELAGWIKDVTDRRLGPEWQCVVGRKNAFGSCLSPLAGHYLNFSIGETGILVFKSA